MEFLMEIVFEMYLELMMFIVPEEKASSKKYMALTAIIAAIVLLGVLALFVWGLVLLNTYENALGWIPIAVGVVLSIIQIFAGFILHDRNN